MALFSVSDIVIAGTLFANALALLSAKLPKSSPYNNNNNNNNRSQSIGVPRIAEECLDEDQAVECVLKHKSSDRSSVSDGMTENEPMIRRGFEGGSGGGNSSASTGADADLKERLLNFFSGFRRYSCVVVLWNFVFIILMMFVFSD